MYAIATCLIFSFCTFYTTANGSDQAAQLVKQLGDSSFRKREQAESELLNLGSEALPAIQAGINSPDKEISERCKKLLPLVRGADFNKKVREFLADTEGKKNIVLPGWKRFQEIAGKEPGARAFFSDIVLKHAEQLKLLESNPQEAARIYFQLISRINKFDFRAGGLSAPLKVHPNPPSIYELALLMLLDSDPKIRDITYTRGDDPEYRLGYLFSRPYAEEYFSKNENSPLFRKLFAYWFDKTLERTQTNGQDKTGFEDIVEACWLHDLKEAVPQLKKLLAKTDPDADELAGALQAFSKYGTEKDLELLKPLLKNESVCASIDVPKEGHYEIQVRDVALGVSIYLSKRNPKDFAYKRLPEKPSDLTPLTFGFRNPDDRAVSFKKWQEFVGKK